MLPYPQIDPVALQIGPVAIHWYGLTYVVAFGLFMLLARLRLRHPPFAGITGPGAWRFKDVEDLLFFGVLGVIIGGRLGYVLFYKPLYYLGNPLEVLAVWKGGMSFHGGLLGVIASQWWFARSRGKPVWQVLDLVAPCVPLGLASGRVGNFINGELWGRLADPALPWGMVFPHSGTMAPRHPSQIYEALLEGVVLFAILWVLRTRCRLPRGVVTGAFFILYAVLRIVGEMFRVPDPAWAVGQWSAGQFLSIFLVFIGAAFLVWGWRAQQYERVFASGAESR